MLTVGALPAGVPKLPAEIAGPLAQFVGAIVLRVSLATTSEATHGGLLKVLIKVPASKNAVSHCSHILSPRQVLLLLSVMMMPGQGQACTQVQMVTTSPLTSGAPSRLGARAIASSCQEDPCQGCPWRSMAARMQGCVVW